jgi:hypothetical protein
MSTVTNVRFQLRRDTATNWASAGNPVLLSGEPGYDTTNKILKVGDGSSTWSLLPAISGGGGGGGGTTLPAGINPGDYLSWNGANWVTGGEGDVKLGGLSDVSGTTNNSVAVGGGAKAVQLDVVIGSAAQSSVGGNVVIGKSATSSGGTAVVIGNTATGAAFSTSVGGNTSTGANGVSVGNGANGTGSGISIGNQALSGNAGITIGDNATGSATSVSIGSPSFTVGTGNVAIGQNSTTGIVDYAIAIGSASANSTQCIAIGGTSTSISTSSFGSIAIGSQANISTDAANSVALGYNARVENLADSSVVIGSSSSAANMASKSVTIGANSYTGSNNVILIGESLIATKSNTIQINADVNNSGVGSTPNANACYIYPIRGADSGNGLMQPGTLWYNQITYEICYQWP